MSRMFSELLKRSRKITRSEFAENFGGITGDVVEMINGEKAKGVIQEAREQMETAKPLANSRSRLIKTDFGIFSNAKELEHGEVAAIDGTTPLPIQKYSAGQALCVGIGSISHRRPMQDSLHYWSSKAYLEESKDTNDFLAREEQGLFGISQTAYLRYYEAKHGLEIAEKYIFFDGTLIYEWLAAVREGVNLYLDLFNTDKKFIGVMKNLKANPVFAKFARALKTGEIYIIQTLEDHLTQSNASNKNAGEGGERYTLPEFHQKIAPRILRGVFKPRKKAFGFEVHEDHLDDMLRIMCADCQMNHAGHEIPFLLNRVDEEVRKNFNPQILKDRIAYEMTTQSEELFFEETDERDLR